MHIRRLSTFATTFLLAACQPDDTSAQTTDAGAFMASLATYCGNAYEGKIVSDDAADAAWRDETIIADFATCTDEEVRIPLHVGDDRSRTWIITRETSGRLSLHHQHNHADGTPDALTMYGGKANADSSATRQSFPAGEETRALFDREGIPVSKDNVWALEIRPDTDMLAYELERPERFFRIEFDLSDAVASPPEPW